MSSHNIRISVNEKTYRSTVDSRITLLDFLRNDLSLTGTHVGCEHGVCGACSILYDGTPVRSCSLLAIQADKRQITTVEGLCNADGSPGVLQKAFCDAHAMQCGYCTPGMLISAHALLEQNSNPSADEIKESIGGNLCRCTGYIQIIEAVQLASQRLRNSR
ncbi:MAG: (2Fe-2S)-binding protein [Magnetovibrio sp.]|nr:(2Fe-2S)-binding protein [Magnetovibrio sp.]